MNDEGYIELLSPLDESLNDRRPATIEPDGSLYFSNVMPSDYRLRTDPYRRIRTSSRRASVGSTC